MTRYEADLERLAAQLAAMVADADTTRAATDIDLVNRTRLGVRQWCRTVLNDIAPAHRGDVPSDPRLIDLALRPVAVLRILLSHDPRPLESNRPQASGDGDSNQQWRKLADAAEVATHEWSTADPTSHPTGDQAWAAAADAAAVAEAAALLDRDLLTPRHSHAPEWARDCWEIAVAAEHVRQLADTGPLPRAQPLRPAPHRARPIRVRTLADLPAALANLAALVTTARHIRPETLNALTVAHARTLTTLADVLRATSPIAQRARRLQVAAALTSHADTLRNVAVACRPLRSLDADDPRPALQMREIRLALRHIADNPRRAATPEGQQALLASLRPALKFAPAVAALTHGHVHAGRWLRPNDDTAYLWGKVGPDTPIVDAAALAERHAYLLMSQLPPPRSATARHRSPHEVLMPELLRRDRLRQTQPGMSYPATLAPATNRAAKTSQHRDVLRD